jgi:bifunctional enzyme CysN/CysC
VDHGKSTLIGRLLYDANTLYDDQLESVRHATRRHGSLETDIDFAFLLDGLEAEREQGITIDVAYRYFSTPKRKFIIADTPGHEQYTRNMVTGASNCDLALIVVDAVEGLTDQTRRHAFIASLLGIRHLVISVNKMDLVDWDEHRFDAIRKEFSEFAAKLEAPDMEFVPMSAKSGANVVHRSDISWYRGRPLLDYLENVHIASDRNLIDLRLPVQLVLRPGDGRRLLAGTVASGIVRQGDEIALLPSGIRSRVRSLSSSGSLALEVTASEAVTVELDDNVDVQRGDVIAHPHNLPLVVSRFDAMLVWMGDEPLDAAREYLLRQTTVSRPARVSLVRYRLNVQTLHREQVAGLGQNQIGRVRIEMGQPFACDAYASNRITGAVILVDRSSGATVGAGMILDRATLPEKGEVADATSRAVPGVCLFVIGEDSVRIAQSLEELLLAQGMISWITDLRRFHQGDLPTRFAHIAEMFTRSGGAVLLAAGGEQSDLIDHMLNSLPRSVVIAERAGLYSGESSILDAITSTPHAAARRIIELLRERGELDSSS